MSALPTRVHVLGCGALGSLVAARLQAAGVPTAVVLRRGSPRWRCVRGDGTVAIAVAEADGGTTRVAVAAVDGVDAAAPSPRVVVCTKAYDAAAAVAAAVGGRRDARLLLLCNGALSLGGLDARAAAGATTHGCYERAPFDVSHAGPGTVWVPRGGFAAALGAAASLNVVALGPDDMAARLWRKLAANCVLNPLTALHRCDNGAVLRDPGRRDVAARVLAEVAAVARADGWPGATAGDLAAAVDACAAENAANFSSMYQDCKRGRRTEVDHLGAWVAARGAALGVDAPENARLAADVRALEPWGD